MEMKSSGASSGVAKGSCARGLAGEGGAAASRHNKPRSRSDFSGLKKGFMAFSLAALVISRVRQKSAAMAGSITPLGLGLFGKATGGLVALSSSASRTLLPSSPLFG